MLNASAITAADDPLLTAVQYQSKNQPMPTVSALLGASIDRYAKQSAGYCRQPRQQPDGQRQR